MKKNIELVLGTMTFGERIFGSDSKEILNAFLSTGHKEIDTAFVYNEGESERLIGEYLEDSIGAKIATKANPRVTGKLDSESVVMQLNESLKRLKTDKVDTFYLHFPDPNTPVKEALSGCAKLYSEGKFDKLGLSNFPAWLVSETYNICKREGWMLPVVYQGLYNPLSRNAEYELNDCLNYYDMKFYAYNPLAGGLLTDKYSGKEKEIKEGRFTNRPNYQQRYWKDSYFEAIDIIKQVCKKYNINIVEASYRWLSYHSMLNADRGDSIIVGISKKQQLEDNISTLSKGYLPDEIVQAINGVWKISKVDAPEYFKFYQPKTSNK